MQVNVAQLLKESTGAERLFDVDEDIDIDSRKVRVKGQARLIRTYRGILTMGNFKAELEIECSRCLDPFQCPVNIVFEEEFFPSIDVTTGYAVEIPEDQQPGYFTIDANHILDLDEAIRQYALLTVPMKPLCNNECAGLCPNCGNNLNRDCCECPAEEIDPRLEALSKLLKPEK
jgi:uncharacterized protein